MSTRPQRLRATRLAVALTTLAVAFIVTGCSVVLAADEGSLSWPSDDIQTYPSDPGDGAAKVVASPVSAELVSLLVTEPLPPDEPTAPAPVPVLAPTPEAALRAVDVPEGATELATDPIESWKDAARLVIDDQVLADAFTAAGYRLPAGSEVYVVEIIDGIDQPAYLLYEAGDGAFSTDFWPASTVKLLAAVAAVEYVADLGFTGDATVSVGSASEVTLSSIYEAAITVSSNEAYDRLLQIAGLDYINGEFADEYGLDSIQYGTSYSGLTVTSSPQLTITEGKDPGDSEIPPASDAAATITAVVDARSASEDYGSNDTDLFDLIEGLRRVMLADELPEEYRFDLPAADLDRIQQALIEASPSFFEAAAKEVFGDDAIVANKAGWVPGSECLDTAYIVDPDTGRSFLIAATQPYQTGCVALGEIAEIALEAVLDAPGGIPLMADAGPDMDIAVYLDGGLLHIDAAFDSDEILMYLDGNLLTVDPTGQGTYRATLEPLEPGSHVLYITASIAGAPVSHRTLTFTMPAVGGLAGASLPDVESADRS